MGVVVHNYDGVDPLHPHPVAVALDHLSVSPVGDGVWEPWLVHGGAQPGLNDTTHENGAMVDATAAGDMAAAAEAEEDDEEEEDEDDDDLHLDYLALANLRVLFRQERDPDYGVTDYLGIRQSTTSTIKNQQQQQHQQAMIINKKRKRGAPLPRPPWKMDACNRWEIGEWCYGLISEFHFPREFAEITMSYVDRYMSRCTTSTALLHPHHRHPHEAAAPPTTKQEVELMALTCFYLAVKLYQTGPVLSARQMAVLSGGTYGIKEISTMEKKILFVLRWRLHPPCPTDFLGSFFTLLSTHEILSPCEPWEDQVLVLSRRMLESATLDYCIVLHHVLPSHLAAAALIYAVSLVQPEPWVPDAHEIIQALNEHSDHAMEATMIDWCVRRLRQICPPVPRPPHSGVPVVSPDPTFDEGDAKAEGEADDKDEWQPAISPNSVTTVRDFSQLPSLPCF